MGSQLFVTLKNTGNWNIFTCTFMHWHWKKDLAVWAEQGFMITRGWQPRAMEKSLPCPWFFFTEMHKQYQWCESIQRRASLVFESICTRDKWTVNSCITHRGHVNLREPDPSNLGPHQQPRSGGGLQTRDLAVQRQHLHPSTQGLWLEARLSWPEWRGGGVQVGQWGQVPRLHVLLRPEVTGVYLQEANQQPGIRLHWKDWWNYSSGESERFTAKTSAGGGKRGWGRRMGMVNLVEHGHNNFHCSALHQKFICLSLQRWLSSSGSGSGSGQGYWLTPG